eukprot:sb/3474032/
MGKCPGTPCPITRPILYSSCTGKYPDRVFTQANNTFLTFLLPSPTGYHNDVFPCDNDRCVDYQKVCNLVDDCGDGSDEMRCENNYQCPGTNQFISLDRVCNGVIDCKNAEDECSELCSGGGPPPFDYNGGFPGGNVPGGTSSV